MSEVLERASSSSSAWSSSSYGQVKFPPVRNMRLSGLDVLSALMTSSFPGETTTTHGTRAQKYTGYMKKQSRLPPYLWRRRWVEVWLEPLGGVSRLVVRSEVDSAMVSAMLPIKRRADGAIHPFFKKCSVCAEHAEFEFADLEQHKIRLRSMQMTPAPLLAALAALSWPFSDSRPAHSLLLALGEPAVAVNIASAVLDEEESRLARVGLRAITVPADANPGDEVDSAVVPPGVARGCAFYAPATLASPRPPVPAGESAAEIDDLLEQAVASNILDHGSAARARRSTRDADRLADVLSRRLRGVRPVVEDEQQRRDEPETTDEVSSDESERYSWHGQFKRQLTHGPVAHPRSFLRVLKAATVEWEPTSCPASRLEPTGPEKASKPRTERHAVRLVVPDGARPGSRLAVRVPHRDEPVTIAVPHGARPGATLELTYAVVSSEKWPGFPYGAPEKAPAWRRERLDARLARLRVDWSDVPRHERVEISLARGPGFLDSLLSQLPRLSPERWRTQWKFKFANEPGLDAGGVAREFWTLVSQSLFSPDYGLFAYAANDNLSYRLSPVAASVFAPRDCDRLYALCGRLVAKALLDRQTLEAPLNRPLLKHLLAIPICFEDLQFVDAALYHNLDWLVHADDDDAEVLCQAFTVTEELFGVTREVELIPHGADIEVNGSNKIDYVEKRFRYAVMNPAVERALFSFLSGFYDVVPLPALLGGDDDDEQPPPRGGGGGGDQAAEARPTPERLDAQELEVILFGTADVDPADWAQHTVYRRLNADCRRVRYFWRLVNNLDPAFRVRLLQWATGTARLPAGGFANLQGAAGQLRPFELARSDHFPYPRAHTCFNRIDLPSFDTYDNFHAVFMAILSNDVTGFDLE